MGCDDNMAELWHISYKPTVMAAWTEEGLMGSVAAKCTVPVSVSNGGWAGEEKKTEQFNSTKKDVIFACTVFVYIPVWEYYLVSRNETVT